MRINIQSTDPKKCLPLDEVIAIINETPFVFIFMFKHCKQQRGDRPAFSRARGPRLYSSKSVCVSGWVDDGERVGGKWVGRLLRCIGCAVHSALNDMKGWMCERV